jgi:hypothetical protein
LSNTHVPPNETLHKEDWPHSTPLTPSVDDALTGQFEVIRVQWDSKIGFEEACSRQEERGDEIGEDDPDLVVTNQAWIVPPHQLNVDVIGGREVDDLVNSISQAQVAHHN